MAKGERAHDPSAERGSPVWERVGVEGGEVISLSGRQREAGGGGGGQDAKGPRK